MFSFIGFRFLWLWNPAAVVFSGDILLYSLSVSSLLGSFKIGGLILLGLTLYVVFFTSQASMVHTRTQWNGNLGAWRVLEFLFRNHDIYCDWKGLQSVLPHSTHLIILTLHQRWMVEMGKSFCASELALAWTLKSTLCWWHLKGPNMKKKQVYLHLSSSWAC